MRAAPRRDPNGPIASSDSGRSFFWRLAFAARYQTVLGGADANVGRAPPLLPPISVLTTKPVVHRKASDVVVSAP
jgi:hypothetical protein